MTEHTTHESADEQPRPMNTGPSFADPSGLLPDRQLHAIDAIVAGDSITDAAEHANVSRSTMYNWLNTVPFNVELNRRRRELHNHINDLVRAVDRSAMVEMANRIEDHDPDATLAWIRARGINRMNTAPDYPHTIDEAVEAQARKRYATLVEQHHHRMSVPLIVEVTGEVPPDLNAVRAVVKWEIEQAACEAGDCDPTTLQTLEDALDHADLGYVTDLFNDTGAQDDDEEDEI